MATKTDFNTPYWKEIKRKVSEKLAFDKPFEMTIEQYFEIKAVMGKVLLEEELEAMSKRFEGVEEFLKTFELLPTQCNCVSISTAARQVLEEQFGWPPIEDELDKLIEDYEKSK